MTSDCTHVPCTGGVATGANGEPSWTGTGVQILPESRQDMLQTKPGAGSCLWRGCRADMLPALYFTCALPVSGGRQGSHSCLPLTASPCLPARRRKAQTGNHRLQEQSNHQGIDAGCKPGTEMIPLAPCLAHSAHPTSKPPGPDEDEQMGQRGAPPCGGVRHKNAAFSLWPPRPPQKGVVMRHKSLCVLVQLASTYRRTWTEARNV